MLVDPARGSSWVATSAICDGVESATQRAMITKTDELKDRIDAKRHQLSARLSELKADTRHEAAEARDKIKARLDEVEAYLKDGWDKVSDSVKTKLNAWMDRD